jgi:hypothetical protein
MQAPEIDIPTACMTSDLDFIEEIRLRRWARENYVAPKSRDESWHPVVLEEMRARDKERGAPKHDSENHGYVMHHDQT